MDSKIETSPWFIVTPKDPIEGKVVALGPMDNMFGYSAYQKRIIFYKNAPENATSILKESLSNVLVHFYPLSGRISYKNKAQLQLHCGNFGADFMEAKTSTRVEDLGAEVLPSEFIDSLCQMPIFPEFPWTEDYPLLSVQVTRFCCGGLSVGVNFSHQVCDGVSFWHFMNSWAEVARLGAPVVLPSISYNIPPQHDEDEREETFNLKLVPRDVAMQYVRKSGWKRLEDGLCSTMIKLNKEKLIKLKSMAPGLTTFEVTCAYIWKRLSQTWEDSENQDKASFGVLVNLRGRTHLISSNFFGNAVLPILVVAPVEEVKTSSLATVGGIIHEAIVKFCNRETIEGGMRYIYKYNNNEEYIPFPDFGGKYFTLVVSSPRHRVYDVDFGWGRPFGNTVGSHDLGHSKIYLFAAAEGDGGIDVTVTLKDNSMELFKASDNIL